MAPLCVNPSRLRLALMVLGAMANLCLLLAISDSIAASAPAGQALLLAIAVNGEPPTEPLAVYYTTDGRFFVTAETLEVLHLRRPGEVPTLIDQQPWYVLQDLGTSEIRLEQSTQVLLVHVPVTAFLDSTYNQHPSDARTANPSSVGGFVNYDLFYQRDVTTSLSGLIETGAFFWDGTLTSRFIGRDVDGMRSFYRLDTQYQRDFPDQTATLVVGDAISGAAQWSRSVYFGGVQWHTNFGTRPDQQPVPLPAISGSAAVPSTVDLYVDGVLRGHQNVDSGPFTLNNIPTISGQGNLTLVVRDALGHQQIFAQNYLTSPSLLRAGTIWDSFETGALHNNFGQASAAYGQGFVSSTLRYGMTDSTTIEAHAEGSSTLGATGFGSTTAWRDIGVFSLGGAGSYAGGREGALGYLQFDHETATYGVSLRTQITSSDFQQLGLAQDEGEPKATSQAQFSMALGGSSTLLVGYTRQQNRKVADFTSVDLGLSRSMGRLGTVFAGVIQSFTPAHSISANLVWTVPFDDLNYVQLSVSADQHQNQATVEYDSVPPPQLGWGYRLRESFGTPAGSDLGATYRSAIGDYSVAASDVTGVNTYSAEMRGGIAALGGHVIATKSLDQSFALVTVPTSVPIDVYANNVKVGQTNADGIALVPNLIAYENNHVQLDSTGLPLKVTLDLTTHDIIPRTRTGVVLNFTAHSDDGATIILQYSDGTPVATGVQVDVEQQGETAEVALRGEVFFANLSLPAQLRVHDRTEACTVNVAAPASADPFPRLGPFTCASH